MSQGRTAAWRREDDSVSESGDPRVVAAVQEYLVALETGKCPPRQEFLARHAEIGTELAHCLDGLELVHRAALDMRQESNSATSEFVSEESQLPLGDFRIVREIGRGGMGIVYEAIQLSLGRRVALKVLPFVASLDPTRLQRFKNESHAAAQLHHTNIVPVYAVGSQRGVHFYAMQLIEGQSLSSLIRDLRRSRGKVSVEFVDESVVGGPVPGHEAPHELHSPADPTAASSALPVGTAVGQGETNLPSSTVLTANHPSPMSYFRTVVNLMQRVVAAVEHAHQFGVIHRDLKPANLLLDERGDIWITDFGLAQFHSDVQLTQTGDLLGTLRYMSPEQAAGGRAVIDPRTDIYSLGITLYELLTLEPAFPGHDRHVLIRRMIEDEPVAPRSIDKSIPVELETIVLKAIAKAPAERYATAQQMADDLQRWLDDKPILARRPTLWEHAARWRRRHRSLVRLTIAFLFLAMLGFLASTIVISREHSKTKAAYQREIEQRAAAEDSFKQAREAVDEFSQLAEEEFADKPSMYQLRRKFLQTALDYYKNFLTLRHGDPTVEAELAATSKRVGRIVDELSVLASFGPLMLISDERVQEELAVSTAQRDAIDQLLKQLWTQRAQTPAGGQPNLELQQQRLAELLRAHEARMADVLGDEQMQRLRQIGIQQQGPFAFKSPEIIAALSLSPEQRKQISGIIESHGPHNEDSQQGGQDHRHGPSKGPPPRGDEPRGPHARERDADDVRHAPPGRDDADPLPKADDGPRRPPEHRDHGAGFNDHFRDHPRSPGPGDHGFGGPHGHGGPGPGDRPPFGKPDNLRDTMNQTVAEINTVLTAEQRAIWQQLSGKPFEHDLHFGPDDWFPR